MVERVSGRVGLDADDAGQVLRCSMSDVVYDSRTVVPSRPISPYYSDWRIQTKLRMPGPYLLGVLSGHRDRATGR
jgi:hypothetical protein